MIQINQCKLPVGHQEQELENKIRKLLRLEKTDTFTYEIRKKSLDARKKPQLMQVYQIWVTLTGKSKGKEAKILARGEKGSISRVQRTPYVLPNPFGGSNKTRPVVVGAGPAGLFCAFLLTECGLAPIVCERGKSVEQRQKDVERFWETGVLDPTSNVQFGEGGAGTFSDGKLNTAVKDPSGRIRFVLETFVRFGAPEHILYEQKPHIGTDILAEVIANMRNYLMEKGCEFRFETCMTGLLTEKTGENRKIVGIRIKGTGADCGYNDEEGTILTDQLILSIGHSARDTFRILQEQNLSMEAKEFAVGFRVEHPQNMINTYTYGATEQILPAAPYKVTSNFPNGRGVYSFCMCPGGYVVNSSSDQKQTVVNGMSYSGRNGSNANSAIIISVSKRDFGASDPLAGMRFQEALEYASYQLGNGRIPQQLFGDYRQNVTSGGYGDFASAAKGAVCFANLRGLFTEDMEQSFLQGMDHFAQIIPGFDRADAILSGVESRTSSPVRILRSPGFESSILGIFPCGEGAGYAGGITSAAVDGLKTAEAVLTYDKGNGNNGICGEDNRYRIR